MITNATLLSIRTKYTSFQFDLCGYISIDTSTQYLPIPSAPEYVCYKGTCTLSYIETFEGLVTGIHGLSMQSMYWYPEYESSLDSSYAYILTRPDIQGYDTAAETIRISQNAYQGDYVMFYGVSAQNRYVWYNNKAQTAEYSTTFSIHDDMTTVDTISFRSQSTWGSSQYILLPPNHTVNIDLYGVRLIP